MNVCMNYKMLEFDRIDISKRVDINKTDISKKCDICHCWYFLDKSFKYEPNPCNGCHDLMQKAMNFNAVPIVPIKESDNDDAVSIMNHSNLNEKVGL